MDKEFWLEIKSQVITYLTAIGPKILFAILAFIIGVFLIKILMRVLKRGLKKSRVELSLKTFIESLSIFLFYGFLIFGVGSIMGIETTSFLAVFGAVGIAIALALQGSLANFAGGVLILVFKPFKVNDLIQVNGNIGFVQQIDILYTRIKTFDGRIITMPNGNVSNSDVDNRTMEKYRRVDLDLRFNFEENIDELRILVTGALRKHPQLVQDLPVELYFNEIGESDMRFKARCWVESVDYWPLYWELLEGVKKDLDANGIKIPIPKKEVFQGDPTIALKK
ncbi:mechanosensitive ion channel [Cryomorpha ignava]|uniref:Mechanosensitive ion channel n=1 Tax=Cryomorpha ignava TaxID=101383 RepID=A0A7K3WPN0_9FLAO|nr:mechanosensitive ion channel domain-containing protein [Cryomorpha ignava]NEN23613.1 mechanosensitive ion channel [Cryomorpha ignava]